MVATRVVACATLSLALAACDREPPKPKVGEGVAAARVNGAVVPHRPDAYALNTSTPKPSRAFSDRAGSFTRERHEITHANRP